MSARAMKAWWGDVAWQEGRREGGGMRAGREGQAVVWVPVGRARKEEEGRRGGSGVRPCRGRRKGQEARR